jgi:signal transduction histidine kinase
VFVRALDKIAPPEWWEGAVSITPERSGSPDLREQIQRERYMALQKQIPLLYALMVTTLVGFHVATSAEYAWKLGLAAPVSLLILYRLHHWWKTRTDEPTPERAALELRRTHLFAIVFGILITLWALRVLTTGDSEQRSFAVLFTSLGALGAAYGLNPLPRSANAILLLIPVPTAIWLSLSGEVPNLVLGISLLLVAFFVHRMVCAHDRAFVALIQSRDEQRRAEEALRQSQKLEAMGQLTGGVAHDFNNLLAPILASFDLLRMSGIAADDKRAADLIDLGFESAERARALVQRLLSFARRQPLQAEAVDVGEMLQSLVPLLESTCGPRIQIKLRLSEGLPPAKADRNQIELALLNLGVNARDAMPGGGTITVAAQQKPAELESALDGAFVVVTVSDNGSGMDPETLARAVEPFFSTKGVGQGTGLGLSMVHGLMAQLGGKMEIASKVGEGTSISLWLPQAAAPAQTPAKALPAILSKGTGTVLLIDDDELVRVSTAELLRDIGYKVDDVASGEEALELWHGGYRPQIIVTDHLMEGMNGLELAERIRSESPEQPIVIASGYAEADLVAARFPTLTKPFLRSELHRVLSEFE